jgi:hypothetical protein
VVVVSGDGARHDDGTTGEAPASGSERRRDAGVFQSGRWMILNF